MKGLKNTLEMNLISSISIKRTVN